MKIILLIVVLSALMCCNDQRKSPASKEISDYTVHSIPRETSDQLSEPVRKPEIIRNETRFYRNLSTQFDFRLTVFNNDFNSEPSGSVLKIYGKNGEFFQKVEFANRLMGSLDLNEVSSFETNVKDHAIKGTDNMYGTMIIEDFNFDGLYDIALMEGCYVNGNSRYCYYLQSEDSVFVLDKFLTRKIQTYPAKRDVANMRLTSSLVTYNSCRKTIQR
jgi:hypothetical protein